MNQESRVFTQQAFALGGVALLSVLLSTRVAFAENEDSCVECHRDRNFLVTNKKLYDYFEQWDASIHKREDVGCADCHGGNPAAPGKKQAHGKGVGVSDAASGIYYKNVAETCGQCHEDVLAGFQESDHYEQIEKEKDEEQGPTCVTCHGSIDVSILDVNTVEAACARCHNEETDNFPENPAEAGRILNRFLAIHRFYRYVSIRAEPEEAREFLLEVDTLHRKLVVTWHTFDLEQIEKETDELLGVLKAKRDELKKKSKAIKQGKLDARSKASK